MAEKDHNQPRAKREMTDESADVPGKRSDDVAVKQVPPEKPDLLSQIEELTALNSQLQETLDQEQMLSQGLKSLLSKSGIAMLFLDRDLKIRSMSPEIQGLSNLVDTDIGQPFGGIAGQIDDPLLMTDVDRVMSGNIPAEVEVQSATGAHYVRHILPCKTRCGQAGALIAYCDVTDIRQSHEAQARTKRFSDSLFATIREPLLVLDNDFTIVRTSRSFHRLFQTTAAQTDGQNLFAVQYVKWDQREMRDLLGRLLRDQKNIEDYQVSIETAAMGERTFVLNAGRMRDAQSDCDLIFLAFEDKSDLLTLEHDLQDHKARLRAIVEATPEPVVTIDENGIIGSFSPPAEAMLGFSSQEVIGKNVGILMPDPDRSKHDEYMARYLRTGEKRIIGIGREMLATRKDGSTVPVRLTVAEWWLDGVRYFTGILHDLTEDMKRREALNRAQKMEAVGQLTGGMAHDFNNLLTIIIGNLELLEMRVKGDQERALLGEALDASNLGAQLTSQLLAFSSNQALTPRAVALNDLIKYMMPILARTLGAQIDVETMLADDLCETLADSGQIESAILNMVINARDAMPDGGTLSIATRNTYLEADYAATQVDLKPGRYVALCVTDTGHGMPREVVDRAFEPFFTTKGPGAGSGLGLSMVYGFAKQSGGHVAIYSEVGHGTTVTLYLPKASDGGSQTDEPVTAKSSETCQERILVVEDDPRVRRLTVIRLNELGYKVVAAEDGPSALDILAANDDIALVLSDIVMPGGMSGFDLADKAQEIDPSLKLLLATGYAKGAQMTAAERTTQHKILRKPYSIKELADTLRALLDADAANKRPGA